MSTRRSNGEGTIYYSEKLKKWIGQFIANGKRKSIYGNTKKEVIQKMHKSLVNVQENKFIDKSKKKKLTYSYKVMAIHSNSKCNSNFSKVKSIKLPLTSKK